MATRDDLQEVVNIFKTLYEAEYRGKPKGRFTLTRSQLRQILAVPILRQEHLTELTDELLKHNFALMDMDDLFAVVELDKLRRARRPTKELLQKLIGNILEDAEGSDDDLDD